MYSEFILKLKKLDRDDFTFVTCHISSYEQMVIIWSLREGHGQQQYLTILG